MSATWVAPSPSPPRVPRSAASAGVGAPPPRAAANAADVPGRAGDGGRLRFHRMCPHKKNRFGCATDTREAA